MSLRVWHGLAGGAHLAQSVALFVLAGLNDSEAYRWPLTFSGWNKILTRRTLGHKMTWMLPVFPLLSSVNHLASLATYDQGYYHDVLTTTKTNWLRWCEYSASAGLMTWLIAVLSGITELRTLISLLIMNVGMQLMGWLIEKRKSEGASKGELWQLMIIAWSMFLAIWTEISMSFSIVVSWDSETKPPNIVYSILGTMFTLFASFGVAQVLYVSDVMTFENYEKTFIGLSLVAKSLLSWLVYGGLVAAKQRFKNK